MRNTPLLRQHPREVIYLKKILIVFLALLIAFICIWTIKMRTPLTPADPYETGLSGETPWWQTSNGEAPTADADWVLDYEIPDNYVPVLGMDELYMVIDEDGNIVKYRQRIWNEEEGIWEWKDVNPDIPQNYEAVEGLENVYRVTDIDGTVRYYKYTRNSDDTYFFTEVDSEGNPIQNYALTDDEIPANFIRIEGTNVYAVYNEYGVLVGYKERVQNEDGTYSWVDCNAPESSTGIADGSGAIPGASGGSASGDIILNGGNVTQTEQGYVETKTQTTTERSNGWIIVYETVVTRTYDTYGELVSTKTEGPTEINRMPESEWNGEFEDLFS